MARSALTQSEFVFSPFVDRLDRGFSFLFFLKNTGHGFD